MKAIKYLLSLLQKEIKTTASKQMTLQEITNLLKYKKQIILQGSSGTGKTHSAKEIANQLTKPRIITEDDILAFLTKGVTVQTVKDKSNLIILEANETTISFNNTEGNKTTCSVENIITAYEEKAWEKDVQNGNDTHKHAFAKYIYEHIADEQTKLIQFHPAYTYEDFVRGITAKNKNGEVEYITENRVLADFANTALNNLKESQSTPDEFNERQWAEDVLIAFAERVQEEIVENGKYFITDNVAITEVEEDAFRYTGNWVNGQRMKFKDLIEGYLQNASSRQEFKKLPNISGLAKQHASYYFKLLEEYKKEFYSKPKPKIAPAPRLKNYVLIIDEINRANLPSVLGELIYALEYRNKAVESMYAIDGDNTIVLPENLYIIGTMNTADRSVGHIDYAIKRRFAFVDILPNKNVIELAKAKELFYLVSELFEEEYLASDFDKKDVQLGHSYFLVKDAEQLKMRLEFEIIPILNEYIKDGILMGNAKKKLKEIESFDI